MQVLSSSCYAALPNLCTRRPSIEKHRLKVRSVPCNLKGGEEYEILTCRIQRDLGEICNSFSRNVRRCSTKRGAPCLQNRHHRLLGVKWYFGEFPSQPTILRERLGSRGYMVDRLRELMLLGQLSPEQKVELSMVLDTISRIVMSM